MVETKKGTSGNLEIPTNKCPGEMCVRLFRCEKFGRGKIWYKFSRKGGKWYIFRPGVWKRSTGKGAIRE